MTSSEALDKAIAYVGSMQALALILGITKGAVSQWKNEARRVPSEHCRPIEAAVNGLVTRFDLRPDIFGERQPPNDK